MSAENPAGSGPRDPWDSLRSSQGLKGNNMPDLAAKRHALNLPAGSVRATHVLGIVALVCVILLVPAQTAVAIPPYLIYLLFLAVGHYFAAHGVTIATRGEQSPSPLYL